MNDVYRLVLFCTEREKNDPLIQDQKENVFRTYYHILFLTREGKNALQRKLPMFLQPKNIKLSVYVTHTYYNSLLCRSISNEIDKDIEKNKLKAIMEVWCVHL